MSDPFEQIRWRGVTTSRRTRAMVLTAEKTLGETLPVYQGGWNPGGVGASAGTHDRDAIDLGPGRDPARTTRVLRRVGFAAWHRHPPLFGEHIHAIPDMAAHNAAVYLSPSAADQITEYWQGGDGLVGNTPDEMPWRPDPRPLFSYSKWEREQRLRSRVRTLTQQIADLRARRQAARDRLENLS